jgi:serine/threonine-protein kinase
MVGQTVGKYRVQDRIGRGGMGTVYRAVDETLHREVAIKVLNSELNDPEVAKRFRAEAITVARLSHPGIATIYELFEHDGQWLMVMEFVKGETLERLVERAGPLSAERAAELVMQALSALAHAHSLGVVHRDLKPANLMLTESGAVKIMDFGIARVSGSEHLTNAGFMMGTPAYMAPEQVLSQEVDARADLYAIGVVLYRLTTGRLPFKGETPFALAQSQVNDPPTPIRTARQGLPEWLEQIVAFSLAKSPGERFQTAQDFYLALQQCLTGVVFVPPTEDAAPTGMMLTPPGLPVGALSPHTPFGTRLPTGSTRTSPTGSTPQVPATSTGAMAAGAGPGTSGVAMPPAASPSGRMPALSEMPTQLHSTAGIAAGTGAQPLPGTGPSTAANVAPTGATATRKSSMSTMAMIAAAAVVVIGIGAFVWSRRQSAAPAPAADAATPATPAPASTDANATPPAATPPPADQTAPDAAKPATVAPAAAVPADAGRVAPPATSAPGARGASSTPVNGAPPSTSASSSTTTAKPDAATIAANGARSASPPATGARGATPPATTPAAPAAPIDDTFHTFKDIKFMVVKANDSQDQDALLNLGSGQITVVPKDGGAAYAAIPYGTVVKATYAHMKDPKWDAALPAPPDNLNIHGFMRGTRHWLMLQSKTGYALLRLDDTNWKGILDAIEARCNLKIDKYSDGSGH